MALQINLNADPLTPGVIQILLVADPSFPGVQQAEINADPSTPGVVQANINFDPLTPGIQFINLTDLAGSAVTGIPVNTAIPTISGAAQVGQTLTASTGTWTQSPASFTYQWNRGGTPIGGATSSTYVPVTADIGSTLTVSVIATNSFGSSAPATSAPTSAVIPAGAGLNIGANVDVGSIPMGA